MTGRTHVSGALASLWLLALLPSALTPATLPLLALSAALGGLLPDLDAARSTLQAVRVGGVQPLAPLARLLNRQFGHRGFLHSLCFLALLALLLMLGVLWLPWLPWPVAMGVLVGYASHLMLDAATPSGVPLGLRGRDRLHLLPEPLRIRTGSDAEDVLFVLLVLAALILALVQMSQQSIR